MKSFWVVDVIFFSFKTMMVILHQIYVLTGFRMTLTPTLRKYDAGVLGAGAVHGIAIPPKMKDFTSSGFCTSQCSEKVTATL